MRRHRECTAVAAVADIKDEETKIMPSPPLFPVPTASAWSYDQVTKLVTNSKLATIVNREASVTPNTFIRDTIEQNEGNGELDPFSYNLLTEFGKRRT